jgi:Domain of unknown function (DUF4157)
MGLVATLAPAAAKAPKATTMPPVAAQSTRAAVLKAEAACDCGAASGFSGRCEACDRTGLKRGFTVDDGQAPTSHVGAASLAHDLTGFRILPPDRPAIGAASSQKRPIADKAAVAHANPVPHTVPDAHMSPIVHPAAPMVRDVAKVAMPMVGQAVPVGPQTKLLISSPGDAAEQEAQTIGQRVAGMSEPAGSHAISPMSAGTAPRLHRRATDTPATTPTIPDQSHSEGAPLPGSVRAFMEPRFGTDFSLVRIHTDEPAAALSERYRAQAFTVGRDIYFGRGHFQPGTGSGRELIAHELTHTIQQGAVVAPGVAARAPPSIQRRATTEIPDPATDQSEALQDPNAPKGPPFRMRNGRMVELPPGMTVSEATALETKALARKKPPTPPPPVPIPEAKKPPPKQPADEEPHKAAAKHQAKKPEAKEPTDTEPKKPADAMAPEAEADGKPAAKHAPPAVTLHMKEPPAGPSAATKQRIAGVKARAGGKATAQATLPPAEAQVADARTAVTPPDVERAAAARAELIAKVQAAPSPEIVALCERIRDVIRNKRPPDEDALVEAKPDKDALDAGNQLNSTVDDQSKKVQDNYGAVNTDAQVPGAAAAPSVPPQPDAAATPAINAKSAVPDPVSAADVSLDKDAADSKKKAEDAGMATPAAQLVQTGPVAEARAAQGELDQAAKEDPAKVLAGQKEALGKAENDLAELQSRALAALTTSRDGTVKGNASHQQSMVGSEESMREKAGSDAKKTFDDARTAVNGLLKDLPATAMAKWNTAKDVLVTQFKNELADVKKRVDDRHAGVGGFFRGIKDAVVGLPDWAEESYTRAETDFGNGVIAKLTEISTEVNAVIAACDLIITNAKARIAEIFAELPQSLQDWAKGEKDKFDGQLDQLHGQVIKARDNCNKDLIDQSSAAVDEVRSEISELRKKAGGLVGRIVSAIGRFLDDPVKFIIEGLLSILGIPPAAFWAVVAKIKKVVADIVRDPLAFASNLLKGIGQGFSQFFDHFGTWLIKGFLTWLLGDLKGVEIPKDLSLKSIATFFLQLMGITWPNIRKILVDKIGAKNVALIEKVYSLVSLLIEKGPAGIYEMIKDQLDPQTLVDQVVDMAVNFMVTAIAKQVAVRLLMLFNPVGAILEAIEAIYHVLKWVFQNAAKIFRLVETIVNGMADIIAGNLGGFALAVERALGMLIPPVLDFIADYFSLGDLPRMVATEIKAMQKWILGLIEKAITWMIDKGKALLAAIGIGKKDDKKGAAGSQVGEPVTIDTPDETHTLSIEVKGTAAVLMIASDNPMSVSMKLADFEKRINEIGEDKRDVVKSDINAAKALESQTKSDADNLVQATQQPAAEGAPAAAGVITDEHKLAEILKRLYTAFREHGPPPLVGTYGELDARRKERPDNEVHHVPPKGVLSWLKDVAQKAETALDASVFAGGVDHQWIRSLAKTDKNVFDPGAPLSSISVHNQTHIKKTGDPATDAWRIHWGSETAKAVFAKLQNKKVDVIVNGHAVSLNMVFIRRSAFAQLSDEDRELLTEMEKEAGEQLHGSEVGKIPDVAGLVISTQFFKTELWTALHDAQVDAENDVKHLADNLGQVARGAAAQAQVAVEVALKASKKDGSPEEKTEATAAIKQKSVEVWNDLGGVRELHML